MAKEKVITKSKAPSAKGKSTTGRLLILAGWLRKKRLQYASRQSEEVFCVQLAERLIEIVDKEPEHKIAKVLIPLVTHEYEAIIFDTERDKNIYPELKIDGKMLDVLVKSCKAYLPIAVTKDFLVTEPSVGIVSSIRREGNQLIAKIRAPHEVWKTGRFAIGIAFEGDPKKPKSPPRLHEITWWTKPEMSKLAKG